MTGEVRTPLGVSVQPGGRAPAPGQLALVQAFINSHFSLGDDHGAELWASPGSLHTWLRQHGVISPDARVGHLELNRALRARAALAALAGSDRAASTLQAAFAELSEVGEGAAVELRFDEDGPRFALGQGATFAHALGLVLGITAGSMIDGRWARLKICPGEDCGWAFYDASRNRTGRWCSMSVCGGRAKARAHYHRKARSPRNPKPAGAGQTGRT